MFKSVLVAVVVGLSGPQCPSGSEPSAATTATGPADTFQPDTPDTADGMLASLPTPDARPVGDDAGTGAATDAEVDVDETPVGRLRRAQEAFAAQRWPEAEAAFREALGTWPSLDDVLRFWALEAAYRGGRLDAARADAEALADGDGPHAKEAALRLADIAFDQQRWSDAATGYKALLAHLPRSVDGAAVRFRLARCREELGDTRKARTAYEELIRRYPESPASGDAEQRLRAMDPAFAISPVWRLERARELVAHREWARAIDELDLIPAGTTDPVPEEVAWERAQAIYKHRRRYEEAAQAFAVVVELGGRHAVEAEFYRARSLARAHQDDEAIAAYREFAKQHPRDGRAADAGFLAASLELYLGRFDAAIQALEAMVGRNRNGPGLPQSRWALGFAYLLAARPADALALLDGTVDDEDDAFSRARALYWGAVARIGVDRKDEAVAKLKAVIGESPLHYYALLARGRLAGLGVEVPPPYPERTVGRSTARETCDALPPEVDVLRLAGLRDDARTRLLAALRPQIADATGDALRALTGELLCVDAVDVVHDHVRTVHSDDWGLSLDADNLAYWEAAYPKAWRERVEEAAARDGMSPYLVWAIMRQESSFDPDVVSSADAIGLLQMIPPTSTRMLEARGETYDDAVLFDPERNIDLGVEYIAWIGQKFHGQVALQAAGFNGGPHNVARWLDDLHETRLDAFVERIPFDQTRNYVRRVITSYARYLYLYETDDAAWPLELPDAVRTDSLADPDY